MEKNNVLTPDDPRRTKQSSPLTCPICGRRATVEGRIKKCPEHGTRPFEKDPTPGTDH